MRNAHHALGYRRGVISGPGFAAPPAQEPAALLALAATMAPNSWRELPSLLLGNGGSQLGWRGPQQGLFRSSAAILARDQTWGNTAIRSYGTSGPAGSLDAGCCAAYDPVTYCFYLAGMGGHDAGGGNGVYKLDLRTLTARIDCDDSPLTVKHVTTPYDGSDIYGDGPVEGPSACHTWNGTVFDQQQRKVLFIACLGPFGIHDSIPAGFQPVDNQTYYSGVRKPRIVQTQFTSPGRGHQGYNFPSEYDPDTQSWRRLVTDLTDPRCKLGYNSMLVYDTGRQEVRGYCPTTGAGGISDKIGRWDRNTNTWIPGTVVARQATGSTAHATIIFHPGDDKLYMVANNLATLSLWLGRAAADGNSAMEYVVELPRRTGPIVTQMPVQYLETCPAEFTSILDPATKNNWYSNSPGLTHCPADNAIYLAIADGYGQVWRLAHPYIGQTWTALNPQAPWPWAGCGGAPRPWEDNHHATQIFNGRWQYVCQSGDGRPLFVFIQTSYAGTFVFKGP